MGPKVEALPLCCIYNSPFLNTSPLLPKAEPCSQLTCSRRTSGHCVEPSQQYTFLFSPPLLISCLLEFPSNIYSFSLCCPREMCGDTATGLSPSTAVFPRHYHATPCSDLNFIYMLLLPEGTTQPNVRINVNTGARSRYHCCRAKAIRITCSEWVCSHSYPPYKAHSPYYIVICGLSGCITFSRIISQTVRFSKNSY